MSKNSCPYCGNPQFILKPCVDNLGNKDTVGLCSICNMQTILKEGIGRSIAREDFEEVKWRNDSDKEELAFLENYDKNWRNYITVFHHNEQWQIFLFGKNDKNEIVVDISEDNIRKCQRIYDDHSDSEDNLLRLLILKIFADKDYKDLASKFLILWKQRRVDLSLFCYFIWDANEALEHFTPKFRNFLLWLMEVNFSQYKEEANEEWAFFCHSQLIGIAALSETIDPESLLFKDFDFRWDDEYLKYYALAKFFYSEEKWRFAFCLFEKLRIYNVFCKVTDDELLEFSDHIYEYDDILYSPPTLQDIDNCAADSFSKIDFSKASEREELRGLFANLYASSWNKETKIQKKEDELDSYSKIYSLFVNIFTELSRKSYEAAFNKWVEWDKSNIRMIGLDIWETTKCLKNLKDGIGDIDKNINNLISSDIFAPSKDFSMIIDMEIKLREFIEENLKAFYGHEDAWSKGVQEYIRKVCQSRAGQTTDLKTPQWAFVSLPQCIKIISNYRNWNCIYKNYFITEKQDAQKSQDELLAFLKTVKQLRNIIIHAQRPLEDKERNEVKLAASMINKIYTKWKTH